MATRESTTCAGVLRLGFDAPWRGTEAGPGPGAVAVARMSRLGRCETVARLVRRVDSGVVVTNAMLGGWRGLCVWVSCGLLGVRGRVEGGGGMVEIGRFIRAR